MDGGVGRLVRFDCASGRFRRRALVLLVLLIAGTAFAMAARVYIY